MARNPSPRKKRKASGSAPQNVAISVPVPQNSTIKVADLKTASKEELVKLLEQAQTSKIGFVILNAPFKVRSVEPVSSGG